MFTFLYPKIQHAFFPYSKSNQPDINTGGTQHVYQQSPVLLHDLERSLYLKIMTSSGQKWEEKRGLVWKVLEVGLLPLEHPTSLVFVSVATIFEGRLPQKKHFRHSCHGNHKSPYPNSVFFSKSVFRSQLLWRMVKGKSLFLIKRVEKSQHK